MVNLFAFEQALKITWIRRMLQDDIKSGLEIFFWTYSSCGASGLNFSLVLTPIELVLKCSILKETKHIIQ